MTAVPGVGPGKRLEGGWEGAGRGQRGGGERAGRRLGGVKEGAGRRPACAWPPCRPLMWELEWGSAIGCTVASEARGQLRLSLPLCFKRRIAPSQTQGPLRRRS